ncbi:MAG TPA: glycosyltransferase family 2 protein [Acidobacteriota bacterium]|nr:glycosyltransferase family 2 protein [Acidobacteriota bacterium]
MSETISVSIVTFNHERWLSACLESVLNQSARVRVTVFDNGSTDASRQIAERFPVRLTVSEQNLGFCAAHNRNIRADDSPYILILNPDVVLDPCFIETLLGALKQVPGAGMAGGKLLRFTADGALATRDGRPILDSTGIYFTPAQRHFDRGSETPDRGQFDKRQLVFGITGAAVLCSREMLEDVRVGDDFFDEDFFAYREDADLSWRAQLYGWKAVYEPQATALHRRAVLPSNRRAVSDLVNFHSVKNRYLLRIKNMDSAVRRRCFPYMWLRDAGIVMYALLRERSSLAAFKEVRRLRPRFEKKRELIQSRRRVAPQDIARWFAFSPVSYDLTGGGY